MSLTSSELPVTPPPPPHALCVRRFSPVFRSFASLSLALGWHAQSDWPAADGQVPGRVALGPFLPVGVVEDPRRSVLQASSPRLRPGQETFLFFQKELSPIRLAPSTAGRQRQMRRGRRRKWHHSTGVTTQPKTGQWHTLRFGGGPFCTLSVPLLFSSLINWWLLTMRDRNIRIGLLKRLWGTLIEGYRSYRT